MADKPSLHFSEVLSEMIAALRFYRDNSCVSGDFKAGNNQSLEYGQKAREALQKCERCLYEVEYNELELAVDNVKITGRCRHNSDITIEIDGVAQRGVQAVQFHASVDQLPKLTITRTLGNLP